MRRLINQQYKQELEPTIISYHLVKFLESDEEPDRVRVGAHSTAYQLILVTLVEFGNGIDEKLTTANYAQQASRDLEWRSSLLLPIATKIDVVRYEQVQLLQISDKINNE